MSSGWTPGDGYRDDHTQVPPPPQAGAPYQPPPPPPAPVGYPTPPSAPYGGGYGPPYAPDPRKSKIAAGILGILLGYLGIHNFYLGYTGKAVAQLLLTILSCFLLSPITMIWGIVEGVMILTGSISTDAAGVPLKD